jgi:hypothetical protein
MPSYSLRLFLYLAPSILLVLPFSALIIVLERVTQSLFRSHTQRNYRDGSAGISLGADLSTDLSINEDPAPTWALLGVGVLGMLLACLSGAGMWELRRVDGRRGAGQRMWCLGVLAMNAVVLGVSVGVLAWTSSLQAAQSGVDLQKDGEYSRETWVCRIDTLYTDEEWAGSACGTAVRTASRVLRLCRADMEYRKRCASCSSLWPSAPFWPWSRYGSRRGLEVVLAGCSAGRVVTEASRACTRWVLKDHHRSINMGLRSFTLCLRPTRSKAILIRLMPCHRKASSRDRISLLPAHTHLHYRCRRVVQRQGSRACFGSRGPSHLEYTRNILIHSHQFTVKHPCTIA